MRYLIAGVSLLAVLASSPAGAAARPAHHSKKTNTVSVTKLDKVSPPDLGAVLALVDKLFPPQPDPDPARLALARTAVNVMWPDGSYGKIMSGMFGGMFDRAMQMKGSDFAAFSSKPAKPPLPSLDPTLHDVLATKDPYFDQRTAAIRTVLEEEAGKISAIVDPRMRDGLSRAMARRLDEHQLADVNAFFATQSGRAFASQYMQLWLDPDAMRSLIDTTPDMMKLMPEMMQRIKAADDKFPQPPKEAAAAAKK
jgi:hypothetical protein